MVRLIHTEVIVGVMKRLATKANTTPNLLTPGERKMVAWHRDHARMVDYINTVVSARYRDEGPYPAELPATTPTGSLAGVHDEWRAVFGDIRAKFYGQVSFEDSFRLCYEALRECMKRRKQVDPGYLTVACRNRHFDHLASEPIPMTALPESREAADRRADEEFRIDLRDAMLGAGLSREERDLCDRRILDGATYDDIAAEEGSHRDKVRRRFLEAVERLSRFCDDYTRCD